MSSPTRSPREAIEHRRTAQLAYQLWERRGRPIGSPEVDWSAAEALLRAPPQDQSSASSAPSQPPANGAIPNMVNTDELFNDEDTPVPSTPALTSFS